MTRIENCLLLPFNRESMQQRFEHRPHDSDPGGDGCWLILQSQHLWLQQTESGLQLPEGEIDLPVKREPLFFGLWDGKPCRIVTVDKDAVPPSGLECSGIRAEKPSMAAAIISLGGLAMQTLYWQSRTRFCGRCGEKTVLIAGEWGVSCPACQHVQYPTISPCVIVLVKKGDEVLLITKDEWPEGRYSLVAGFVDMGECLEEAVVREAVEETGIRVKNIEYVGSQSWPFPSQLMVGYVAEYDGGEIVMEDDEISDAQWFKIDNLPDMPPQRSIARYILDHFAIPQG